MLDPETTTFIRQTYGQISALLWVARRGEWFGRGYQYPDQLDEALSFVEANYETTDTYLCAQPVNIGQKRDKAGISVATALSADLDTCHPSNLKVRPTYVVESSPGRWQAWWVLEQPVSASEAELVQRRIAYYHRASGADVSGWDISQYLRIPGTLNHKYSEPHRVRITSEGPANYRLSDFDCYPSLTIEQEAEPTEVGEVEPFDLDAYEWLAQSLETDVEKVSDGERHDLGFRLACRCAEKGLTRGQARFVLANHAPTTSKVTEEHGRADGPAAKRYIEKTVSRAYAKHDHEGQTCETAECPNKPESRQINHASTNPTDEDVAALEALLLDSDQLVSLADPEPLIAGWLDRDTLASLIAKPGDGKSFIALSMAGAVGTGRLWYGRPVHQGLVIYLVAEGARGIKKRVRAWEKITGTKMANVKFLPRPVQAASKEWDVLTKLCAKLRPALIIIDTQARVTVGMEENSSKDMGEFVERLEQLRRSCEACVLAIHHKGRNGEYGRGSSALDGAVHTILGANKEIDKKTKEQTVTLSNAKQKDDEVAADLVFSFQSVEVGADEDGKPITSAILRLAGAVDMQEVQTNNETKILDTMRITFSTGGTKPEIKKLAKLPEASFYRSWDKLIARGAIEQRSSKWFVVEETIQLARGI